MVINVAQLLKAEVGARRQYDIDELGGEGAPESGTPLRGRAELTRTDRSILVQATLTTELRGRCDRCLEPVRQPLTVRLEEEFYPTVDVLHGGRPPEPESPEAFRIDDQHQLNLGEAIRQYLIIGQPLRLLCRPRCAGLCLSCGANLNLGRCTCPPDGGDQRWATLRQLLEGEKFGRS